MYGATDRICREYENPAVKNVETRYSIAVQCEQTVFDDVEPEPEPVPDPELDSCVITVRVLRRGMKGRDVLILQTALLDMGIDVGRYGADGDFGGDTENAVLCYQRACNLDTTGVVGEDDWQVIFQ